MPDWQYWIPDFSAAPTGATGCPAPKPKCVAKVAGLNGSAMPRSALWPVRLAAVVESCQLLGKSLRDGNRIDAETLCTFVGSLIYPAGGNSVSAHVQSEIRDIWTNASPDFDASGLLAQWNQLASVATGADWDRTANVLAVRACVQYLADAHAAWSRGLGHSDGRGFHFGGGAFHLAATLGAERADSREVQLTGQVRTCLVVAVDILDQCVRSLSPTGFPNTAESIVAWLSNEITDEQLRAYILANGGRAADFDLVSRAARRKPETVESGILRNRQVVDDKGHDRWLRQLGFTDKDERAAVRSLRFDVPGPSDLVRFAVRHAFEPEILAALGYNEEYRPALDFYHQTAGLNYKVFTGPLKQTIIETSREFREIMKSIGEYARTLGVAPPASPDTVPDWFAARYTERGLPEPTWAVMYWWSHWVLPSPGQGYAMLQRLRGDPNNPATWRVPGVKPFLSSDLQLLLRANDYPPFWRDKLEAISYRIPSVRYLRIQIKQETITDEEVVQQLMDSGYHERLARPMGLALVEDVRLQERERRFRAIKKELDAGWELGLVTDDEFLNTYKLAGLPDTDAQVELNAAVYARNVRQGKELVAQVRKGYLRGTFDRQQANVFMVDIGIVDRRRQEYLRVWDAERQAGRKEATAGQLRKAVISGDLDLPSYTQRLRNLDYTDDAIDLALSDARQAKSERSQRVLQGIARDRERLARERITALRDAERQLKEQWADLAKSASPSRLKTWWCAGEIELADVEQRLRALGISEVDIPRWLKECDTKRAKNGLPTYDEAKAGQQTSS